ncbi:MAG: dihydroneopterin aldolase [Candidatus Omnitrophica bacterium]|nr:dihydroneopterin aldolase [Candidatus Omnitrophota bacterium]
MASIHIENIRLRTIIGINDWEREHKQDIIINIHIHFDPKKSIQSDNIKDTIDYKTITKKVIDLVEQSNYYLIEKLADAILNVVMDDPLIMETTVKVDKPFALRFTDSVSIELTKKRP